MSQKMQLRLLDCLIALMVLTPLTIVAYAFTTDMLPILLGDAS